MRGIKKLLSIVMVLTLVLALGVSAFADGPEKADITISDANGAGSTYEAYKLLDLTTSAAANTADKESKGFAYTVNPKYLSILQEVSGVTDAPDPQYGSTIVGYISSLDTDALRTFADKVFKAIEDAEPEISPDVTAEGAVFADVDQGYYLIVENLGTGEGAGAAVRSLVMLDTAGRQDVTVTTKEEKPSSGKKVKDVNDSDGKGETGWQDSADYDIGDDVPFQLTGTMPKDIESYESYKVVFHDKQSAGLTFNKDSVSVKVGEQTLKEGQFAVRTEGLTDGCAFEIEIADVKAVAAVAAGTVITVDYTSQLNTGAVIGGAGNPNEMFMEFTNDHYGDGTGTTPNDKVVVFTYDLDVNKVDGENKPLTGAEFALYKKVAAGTEGAVALDEKGRQLDPQPEGTADKIWLEQDVQKNADGTIFTSKGLDDGEYKLVETVTPAGYNAIAPKDFTISAEHEVESADPKLTGVTGTEGFSFTLTPEEGKAMGQTDIQNLTGLELPSTGGIGTTIFYVVGAILVAGAVILLVTKKRVSGANK